MPRQKYRIPPRIRANNNEDRVKLAKSLRSSRRLDSHYNWAVSHTGLSMISTNCKVDISSRVTKMENLRKNRSIRVLDLGCLKGRAIIELKEKHPQAECHGMSLRRDENWRKSPNIHWKVDHAEKMRYPNNYFDFVYSYFGITHAQKIESSLKELHRILRRKGETVFNIQFRDLERLIKFGNKDNVLQAISKVVKHCGFRVLSTHKFKDGSINSYSFHVQKK